MRSRTILVAAVLTMLPCSASATPSFPDVIATHLELTTAPECTLCHTGTPARGTVTTPFGSAMRSRGARAYDEESIQTALDALAAEKKDSDADGTPDIDELKAGTNPNAGAGGAIVPEYGCATANGSTARDSAIWLAVVMFAFGAGRRRRSRRTS